MSMICIDSDSQTYVDCPESNYCNLTINWIDHGHTSFVNVDIPSEISRDYTWDWVNFDIDISWYNVDSQYMEDILAVQNYTPTDEDFTTLITEWLPKFGILLFVCLFVILVFYMFKKIF